MAGSKRKQWEDDHQASGNGKKARSGQSVEPRVDPTYGQRSAIPGLDDDTAFNDGDELDYNEDISALEYLRSVRNEATGIPNLLVAPRELVGDDRSMYENGIGDFRGRYEGGAFVSFPNASLQETPKILDAQVSYFNSILRRYDILRSQLRQTPPPDVINKLGEHQPTYVKYLNRNVSRHWSHVMSSLQPPPAQVACMDKGSVLRLIELLTMDGIMKRGTHIELSISQWTWSLLARLPDRGELTSEEIGILRELGKKAVLVGTGLGHEQSWEEGLLELEAGLKGGSSTPDEIPQPEDELDEEEPLKVTNDDDIDLDLDLGLDLEFSTDRHAEGEDLEYLELQGKKASPLDSKVSSTQNTSNALADEPFVEQKNIDAQEKRLEAERDGITNGDEGLEAVKAQLLRKVCTQHVDSSVNLEPEIVIDSEVNLVPEPADNLELLKWNTKATVDMIITVAGEIYGQRDLLEFRSMWTNVM